MRTLGFALALTLACSSAAQARRESTYAYPYSRVWTAALRMLRVDFASPITEKDRESGYFLFEYPDSGKTYPGSVEIVRIVDRGVESARVVIQVPGLPSYFELMLLDRLTRKLSQDYGLPNQPKPEPRPGEATPAPTKGGEAAPAQQPQAQPEKSGTTGEPAAREGASK
jgi:hypothetical protein